MGLKHGSDTLEQGHLLSQNWGALSAEEFGFSAGPEACWKVLWKRTSKLPPFIRALYEAATGGVGGAVVWR